MSDLIETGRKIANSRVMRGLGPLRGALKKTFLAAASQVSKGATVQLGQNRTALVPWDFVGAVNWSDYEPQSLEFLAGLVDQEPETLFVDIGCAIGAYSLLALSVSRKTEVYSMDADLMALTITRHICRNAGAGRHHLIWGFCADNDMASSNPLRGDLAAATALSDKQIASAALKPRLGANSYVCLDGKQSEEIPCWDMDSLLGPVAQTGRPIVVKVDIEGAEIAMVRGAAKLADYPNVQMLLSVHPHVLPQWQSSAEEVRSILAGRGYEIRLLEICREQHWWVRKAR
jgi:FkbM family methyltransferase